MSFEQNWNAGGSDGQQPPPPGVYNVALTDARAFTSQAGRDVMILEFAGDGIVWSQVYGLGSPSAAKVARAQAANLGVEVDKITSLQELEAALSQHVGSYYVVETTRRGEYVDTWVRGRVEGDVPADTSDMQPETADADIPF